MRSLHSTNVPNTDIKITISSRDLGDVGVAASSTSINILQIDVQFGGFNRITFVLLRTQEPNSSYVSSADTIKNRFLPYPYM